VLNSAFGRESTRRSIFKLRVEASVESSKGKGSEEGANTDTDTDT
jgi:hypothetical protein